MGRRISSTIRSLVQAYEGRAKNMGAVHRDTLVIQHNVAKAKGFAIADHALSLYAHCVKDNCVNRPKNPRAHNA